MAKVLKIPVGRMAPDSFPTTSGWECDAGTAACMAEVEVKLQ